MKITIKVNNPLQDIDWNNYYRNMDKLMELVAIDYFNKYIINGYPKNKDGVIMGMIDKKQDTKRNCFHCDYWGINFCVLKNKTTMFYNTCECFTPEKK